MVACAEGLRHPLRILGGVGLNGGGEIATIIIDCIVLSSEAQRPPSLSHLSPTPDPRLSAPQ